MTTVPDPRPAAADAASPVGVMLAIVGFPMLSDAFRAVIEAAPDLRVVAVAEARASILDQARAARPDVIVLECESVGGTGCGTVDAITAIRDACPDARVIAMDCRCAAEPFGLALKAGASGFLTREALDSDVVGAIRGVAAGHTWVSPSIVTRMVDTYVRGTPDATLEDPYDSLSERERDILLLAAMGHTNREIARSLRLSEQAVHSSRAGVMEKLGLHDRVELLRYSIRRGLVSPSAL
jgi:two-component system response regulator NreC